MTEQEIQKEKNQESAGKLTALIFSLIVAVFLGWQCYSHDKRGEAVPVLTWLPCLVFIGNGLGVAIDAKFIGQFFVK